MIQKYRAWSKQEKRLILSEDILAIDYENEEIVTQKIHSEDRLPNERDIYTYDFDAVVLMQSSRLKDKRGKRIFEGDILCDEGYEGEDNFVYVIVSISDGSFVCDEITNYDIGYGGYLIDFIDCYSVVGNIYTNPGLAEVKQ